MYNLTKVTKIYACSIEIQTSKINKTEIAGTIIVDKASDNKVK